MYHLVVIHPFGSYAKGQAITDPDEVAGILNSPKHQFVNKVPEAGSPFAPAPAPSKKSDK